MTAPPADTAAGDPAALLRPYPTRLVEGREVGTRVNSPKADDPGLVEPVCVA